MDPTKYTFVVLSLCLFGHACTDAIGEDGPSRSDKKEAADTKEAAPKEEYANEADVDLSEKFFLYSDFEKLNELLFKESNFAINLIESS